MIYDGWSKMTRFEKICVVLCIGAVFASGIIHFYVRREIPWREPAAWTLYALSMLAVAGVIWRKNRAEALVFLLGAVGWAICVCVTKL